MSQVRAFVATASIGGKPSGEVDYKAHLDLIDTVLVNNGGLLQSDGSWLQVDRDVNNDFAQELPTIAQAAGHEYIPVVNPGTGTDKTDLMTVLDDSDLQEIAAAGIVTLATTRFDAPWDAVGYDICFVTPEYVGKHEEFLLLIAETLHGAGLRFAPICQAWLPDYANRLPSLSVIAQIADTFDHYCYNWTDSVGPYWWGNARTVEALPIVPAAKTYLGIGNFSLYWPVTEEADCSAITHAQAMTIIASNGATVQWIESDGNGLVREKYAKVGAGHIWLSDGDCLRFRFSLADEYGLAGIMLYAPGLGETTTWNAIRRWKNQAYYADIHRHRSSRLYSNGGIFSDGRY